ncbi:MAG: hypothetical protein HFE90_07640 [Firmicutes bacterium]|nr:hypothetical protein [Bacillota bacterium]
MAGKGTLVVQLYTARRAIPIMGAAVTVSRKVDEGTELIAFRSTNQNGITEPIEIVTPDISESLSPNGQPAESGSLQGGINNAEETEREGTGQEGSQVFGSEKPFTVVDIQIDHPQYYSVLIENAQIFPDQESRQRLQLIPLPEFMSSSDNIIINVTPQNL